MTEAIKSINEVSSNYVVVLKNDIPGTGEDSLYIRAPLPEDFGLNSRATWASAAEVMPFLASSIDVVGNLFNSITNFKESAKTFASNYTGRFNASSILTKQYPVWQGNEPVSFQIPFVFHAFSDPKSEVVDPIQKLLKFMSPSVKGNILYAPGPRVEVSSNGVLSVDKKYNLTLKIGSFITIKDVLITDVSPVFATRFTADGYPVYASAEVQLRTLAAVTSQDIENWFSKKDSYLTPQQQLLSAINEINPFSKVEEKMNPKK